nr:hypothetical protein [uncultured Allomuricauda sp.]
MTKKECSICCVEKPIDKFYRREESMDGYHKICIPCYKKKYRKPKNVEVGKVSKDGAELVDPVWDRGINVHSGFRLQGAFGNAKYWGEWGENLPKEI